MNTWLNLVFTLPTENATLRMRLWRGIKASGASTLRDGVYLLPNREDCREVFQGIADEVLTAGGSAYLLDVAEPAGTTFAPLFDRSEDYRRLLADIATVARGLKPDAVGEGQKQVRKLRKAYATVTEIDFFPGEAQRQAEAALLAAEAAVAGLLSPDEPHAAVGSIPRLHRAEYQGRRWATRQRPWVDRLASAWLIRRFIDTDAQFLWLAVPGDCPADALGFDFDGAAFTHVDGRVTFETLLASFGLEEDAALSRLGTLVHFLDVGGIPVPEASGLAAILEGLRQQEADDDRLLAAALPIFDALALHFSPSV